MVVNFISQVSEKMLDECDWTFKCCVRWSVIYTIHWQLSKAGVTGRNALKPYLALSVVDESDILLSEFAMVLLEMHTLILTCYNILGYLRRPRCDWQHLPIVTTFSVKVFYLKFSCILFKWKRTQNVLYNC